MDTVDGRDSTARAGRTFFLDEPVQRVEVEGLLVDDGDLERRALQLPEARDLVEEVEFDARLRLQFVQTLDARRELAVVHVDRERRLPVLSPQKKHSFIHSGYFFLHPNAISKGWSLVGPSPING